MLTVPQKQEAKNVMQGHIGSTGAHWEAEEVRGIVDKSLSCGFHWKEQERQDKQA